MVDTLRCGQCAVLHKAVHNKERSRRRDEAAKNLNLTAYVEQKAGQNTARAWAHQEIWPQNIGNMQKAPSFTHQMFSTKKGLEMSSRYRCVCLQL